MDQHQEKIELLKKYYTKIQTISGFQIGNDISRKKLDNAKKKFASGLDESTVIGFYDTTVAGSGKSGYLFTDTKVYYLEVLEKPKKIWYDDIEDIELYDIANKDCNNELQIKLYDGTKIDWTSIYLNKTPLYRFFKELLALIRQPAEDNIEKLNVQTDKSENYGAMAGGISSAAYGQINKLYEEEKFHGRQGHGFAAERANNLYDNLTGHDAKIVGDDNVKNGADRMVDGIFIQSKYCQTGSACVNECFDE